LSVSDISPTTFAEKAANSNMTKPEPVQQTALPARFNRAVVRAGKAVNFELPAQIVNVRPKKAGQVGMWEKNF
jgi:hypothetical protein